jgi:hypothetical protein
LTVEPALDAVLGATGRNLVLVPDCSAEGLATLALKEGDRIVREMTHDRAWVRRVTCFEDSRNSATAEEGL